MTSRSQCVLCCWSQCRADACRRVGACDLDEVSGRLTIRRALQRQTWRHGCDNRSCGRKRAAECPGRYGGGLVVVQPKSHAGRRVVDIPEPLMAALKEHRRAQAEERQLAADLWREGGWIFTQPTGRPIDPRADHGAWKDLLRDAGVRDARLHDARHTAATMLLVLKVPTRAVMDIMGWSQASMAGRYQHVPDELRRGVDVQLGGLLWK